VRLVICDRHRLVADSLAAVLVQRGVEAAAVATSAEEALAAVAANQPDLCLVAASLPARGGLGVLRAMGERHPQVKVVLLVGTSDAVLESAAIEGGAAGLILKDQHVEDILHALARVKSGERVFDSRLLGAVVRPLCRARDRNRLWDALTMREQEVLMRMMEGECTRQIARSLAISVNTARTHVENVLAKMGVHSRLEATVVAARSGLPGPYALGVSAGQVAGPG